MTAIFSSNSYPAHVHGLIFVKMEFGKAKCKFLDHVKNIKRTGDNALFMAKIDFHQTLSVICTMYLLAVV